MQETGPVGDYNKLSQFKNSNEQRNGSQNSIPKIKGRILKLGSRSKINLGNNITERERSLGTAARASSDTRSIGLTDLNSLTKSKTKIRLLNKN